MNGDRKPEFFEVVGREGFEPSTYGLRVRDSGRDVFANRSQFVTGSQKHRSLRPWVFGEHGALMAANVVRRDRAVQMSIFVTRAFVRMREHMAANAAILKRLALHITKEATHGDTTHGGR